MDEKQVKAVEAILERGDRVELIPVKNGVKIIHIRRKEITPDKVNTNPVSKR